MKKEAMSEQVEMEMQDIKREKDADQERKKKKQAGFTLIEIMVVVMIIGMLAALVGVRVYDTFFRSQRKVAATQIRNLMTALDLYYMDNGRYPTTEQGLQALVEKPTIPPIPRNYPANGYLDTIPKDPWGNDYVYHSPGINGGPYSIESYGADGLDGGEGENADIESWNLGGE